MDLELLQSLLLPGEPLYLNTWEFWQLRYAGLLAGEQGNWSWAGRNVIWCEDGVNPPEANIVEFSRKKHAAER